MNNDFVLYQKFADLESAESFAEELRRNDIVCHLENNNHSYVKVVGYNAVDVEIGVNIKQADFLKADEVLENLYKLQIGEIDTDYYLFEFTTDELLEIINNPFEWGKFDYQLAKKILRERDVQISDDDLLKIKGDRMSELRESKGIPKLRLFCYYVLCFIMPPYAMINGFIIMNSGTILPSGEKVYYRPESDRKHGKTIVWLSVIFLVSLIIGAVTEQSDKLW